MNDEIFRPLTGNTFQFNCHKGISCFTECCAKLRLALTPYDILRMKNRLGMSSDQFLDKHTDTDLTLHWRFPMVRLRMMENEKKTCPFVTPDGCTIYEDRPGACRLYPVGRAARLDNAADEDNPRDKFFLVNESHCLGFHEERPWTLEEWLNHEGVSKYNAMNDKWLKIVGSKKVLGPQELIQKKLQVFFMASYNLDKFRSFLFKGRFFDRFAVNQDTKQAIKDDDEALMDFALDWLRFSLFGEKTLSPR